MKRMLLFALLIVCGFAVKAQQRLDTRKMNYIMGLKPNNILYRDTLYSGSRQFSSLFYRTGDMEIVQFYERHQSNKIAGNVLGVAGTIATVVGLGLLSDNRNTAGWLFTGGGFVTTIAGGYLLFKGQQNLQAAVVLFNSRYNKTAFNIGVGDRRAGLALNF